MNIPTIKVKILSNRSSSYLKEYFFSFFLKVKYIVIDRFQNPDEKEKSVKILQMIIISYIVIAFYDILGFYHRKLLKKLLN